MLRCVVTYFAKPVKGIWLTTSPCVDEFCIPILTASFIGKVDFIWGFVACANLDRNPASQVVFISRHICNRPTFFHWLYILRQAQWILSLYFVSSTKRLWKVEKRRHLALVTWTTFSRDPGHGTKGPKREKNLLWAFIALKMSEKIACGLRPVFFPTSSLKNSSCYGPLLGAPMLKIWANAFFSSCEPTRRPLCLQSLH